MLTLPVIRLRPSALRWVLAASLALAVLSLLLWFQQDVDRDFLLAHNSLRDHPDILALARAFTRFGMSALCLLLVAAIAASPRYPPLQPARPLLLVVLLTFAAAAIASSLLKEIFGRARPIVELAGQLNTSAAHSSASFPSGHAAKSVALALPFLLLVPAGSIVVRSLRLVLLLTAALVCYSRIVLGAHYLSDVLAGAALALACLPIAIAASNRFIARVVATPEKLNTAVHRWTAVLLALAILLPFL